MRFACPHCPHCLHWQLVIDIRIRSHSGKPLMHGYCLVKSQFLCTSYPPSKAHVHIDMYFHGPVLASYALCDHHSMSIHSHHSHADPIPTHTSQVTAPVPSQYRHMGSSEPVQSRNCTRYTRSVLVLRHSWIKHHHIRCCVSFHSFTGAYRF